MEFLRTKDLDVYEAALQRFRQYYDDFGKVAVSFSGGKDSTICMELAVTVARERGCLPVKVFWLDQEIEWRWTVEYVRRVKSRPEIDFDWYQVEFDFTNSASPFRPYVRIWDKNSMREREPDSISGNFGNRFHEVINNISAGYAKRGFLVIEGLRIEESLARQRGLLNNGNATPYYSKRKTRGYPIFDWKATDVYTALGKFGWDYNAYYDYAYRAGKFTAMRTRVSSIIHETSWQCLKIVSQFDPDWYDLICERVPGVHAVDSLQDEFKSQNLPECFASWHEYFFFLLNNYTQAKYRDLFLKAFNRSKYQDEDFCKAMSRALLINDVDLTTVSNYLLAREKDEKTTSR